MPTYLKAKSPEDGWIRVVRKIMDSGMVRVDERGSETRWHDNVMIHIADPYSDRVSKKYPFSEGVLKETEYEGKRFLPCKSGCSRKVCLFSDYWYMPSLKHE